MDEKELGRFIYRIITCRDVSLIRTSLEELKEILIRDNAGRDLIKMVTEAIDDAADLKEFRAKSSDETITGADLEEITKKKEHDAYLQWMYKEGVCRCGGGAF